MKFRKKYPNMVLILTGLSFLASGFDCIENNLKILGFLSIFVAFLNFVSLFFFKKYPFYSKIIMLIINALFALASSYLFLIAGKDKIQYGWLMVFVAYLIATILFIKKNKIFNNKIADS